MRQTKFQIGDRCLFSFNVARNIPVEVVGDYEPSANCVWVAPDNPNDYMGVVCSVIGCRKVFATHIEYLDLVERPTIDEDTSLDISNLI